MCLRKRNGVAVLVLVEGDSMGHNSEFGNRLLGGFFPLSLPEDDLFSSYDGSILDRWTQGSLQLIFRRNCRSVLAEIMHGSGCKRLLLPDYCCSSLHALDTFFHVESYPVSDTLTPRVDVLADMIAEGDAVLGINYFGMSTAQELSRLHKDIPEALFIEDCAQDIYPDAPWGDWQIFSPRKLIGVPNGGIGVCRAEKWKFKHIAASQPQNIQSTCKDAFPRLLRYEDKEGTENSVWFKEYQAIEASHEVEVGGISRALPMSRLSRYILEHTSAKATASMCVRNQEIYKSLLPDELLLFNELSCKPLLGVPVLLPRRDEIAQKLASQGIFCAIHWPNIPDHAVSSKILTLPSDYRLAPNDIHRISQTLVECL